MRRGRGVREIEELLYRDFAGRRVRDPDAVIFAGLADQRHEERVAPLTAIMEDPGSPPIDRLLACTALTGWGERAGYAMVVAVARRPCSAPWYESSLDRRYSVDDTFSWLATAVDISDGIADVKGTRGERIEALRALIRVADTEFFDSKLDYAIGEQDLDVVAPDIIATVERGVQALSEGFVSGRLPRFDLLSQLVDLASVLAGTAEPDAVRLGYRLLELDHSPKVLRHAVGFVARGTGEASRTFGEYLTLIGSEEIRERVAGALDRRDGIAGGGTGSR